MERIAVYTAISQGYDDISVPCELWAAGADFIAYVDPHSYPVGWQARPIESGHADPCRNAKLHKILSHRYLADYAFSVWVDGSILITSSTPVRTFVEEALGGKDLAVFKHRTRNCIYEEMEACARAEKDCVATMRTQMQLYRDKGYPAANGLGECTVIVRRHTRSVEAFNEAWHLQIAQHSRRDQLSFDYVAHAVGLSYAHIPGLISKNQHFVRRKHTKHHADTSIRSAHAGR